MWRQVSVAQSEGDAWSFDTSERLPITLNGTEEHQPYTQITWKWLNMYLGLVMVYDADDPVGEVHCRMVYSTSLEGGGEWRWVGGDDVLTAPDLIPLGDAEAFDSHIIFAAAKPFQYGTGDAVEEYLYYMGGNGPHDDERDSAFGLAKLRPHGFACVRKEAGASVYFRTPSLLVTSATLAATADFIGEGSLRLGVVPDGADMSPPELDLDNSVALTYDATDVPMVFIEDADLTSLIGTTVQLLVSLEGEGEVLLYTLGFGA